MSRRAVSPPVSVNRNLSWTPAAPYTPPPIYYVTTTTAETIGSSDSISIVYRLSRIGPRTSIRLHRWGSNRENLSRSYLGARRLRLQVSYWSSRRRCRNYNNDSSSRPPTPNSNTKRSKISSVRCNLRWVVAGPASALARVSAARS